MKPAAHSLAEEEEKPVEKKVYKYDDMLQFQNPSIYSSVGRMLLSTKSSAPHFGFGTSSRQKQAKVYQTEELSRTHFIGKTSPGPNYEVRDTDKFSYKDDPSWSFGKSARTTLGNGPKHAHYTRMDVDFDPLQADEARRTRAAVPKVGLESRFASTGSKAGHGTPGPEYNPSLRPEIQNSPKFSFGSRREVKGASPLMLLASTPTQVGPGTYTRLDQPNTSAIPDSPNFSFPKDQKLKYSAFVLQKNQTYDTRSCVGDQISSKNRSMSQISIGKAHKDVFTGIFKDHMSTHQTKLRIAHPRF